MISILLALISTRVLLKKIGLKGPVVKALVARKSDPEMLCTDINISKQCTALILIGKPTQQDKNLKLLKKFEEL